MTLDDLCTAIEHGDTDTMTSWLDANGQAIDLDGEGWLRVMGQNGPAT